MTHRTFTVVILFACSFATGLFAGCQSLCPPPIVITVHHTSPSGVTLPASMVIVEPLAVDNVLPGTVQPFDQGYGEYLSQQTANYIGQISGLSVRRSDVQATTLPVGGPVQPISAETRPAQGNALVTTQPIAAPVCPPGTARIGGKVEIYVTDVFGSGPVEKWNGTTVTLTGTSAATQPGRTAQTRRPAPALRDVRPVRRFVRVSASYLIQTGSRCPGIVVQVWTPQIELTNEMCKPLPEHVCDAVCGKEAQVSPLADRFMVAFEGPVIMQMLDECAQQLCMILQPHEQSANLTVRPTLQPYGARGIKRLQAGNYVNAVNQLETAVYAEPDDGNLHFDLAVADEAAGYFSAAWQHYREALSINGHNDIEAAISAKRIEHILQREDYLRQLALAQEQANVEKAK
jgi:hypothetical protein